MEILVKNMVCQRCIVAVRQLLEQAGIPVANIELGKVTLADKLAEEKEQKIKEQLQQLGFEWLDDRQKMLMESVKQQIIRLVHYEELDEMKEPLSSYLSRTIGKEYSYISRLFSESQPYTIEQFFLLQKTERVKEWLVYNEYSLSEIAFRLGYSSVAHLSAQFKKITGFSPSAFRRLKEHHRKSLDQL